MLTRHEFTRVVAGYSRSILNSADNPYDMIFTKVRLSPKWFGEEHNQHLRDITRSICENMLKQEGQAASTKNLKQTVRAALIKAYKEHFASPLRTPQFSELQQKRLFQGLDRACAIAAEVIMENQTKRHENTLDFL